LSAISIVLTVTLIAFTRMVLGAHSLKQVALGSLLGAWLACSFHAILRDRIDDHIQRLGTKWMAKTVKATQLVIGAVLVQVMIISMFTLNFEPELLWVDNIVSKCGD
jgi:peptidoglycan biosynthesis protein MviN/MurJ (putative lipid II flippase)